MKTIAVLTWFLSITLLASGCGETESQHSTSTRIDESGTGIPDWGILNSIPGRMGPSSPFHIFATELHDAGAWDPQHYWLIGGPTGVAPKAHMMLTVTGEGKVYVEAVVDLNGLDGDTMWVTLVFKPGELSDLNKATANRNTLIITVARAMHLTDQELTRLESTLLLLPLVQSWAIDDAMVEFVGYMPQRVQMRFAESLRYYTAPDMARSDNILLDGFGPAIGFSLSERYVAEVAFMGAAVTETYDDTNYHQFGPWWSVMIHDAAYNDYTSADAPEKRSDGWTWLPWPRLTTEGIDALKALIPE